MKRFSVILCAIFLSTPSMAAQIIYDIDFEAPTHVAGSLPTTAPPFTSTAPDEVSRIMHGTPTVESSFGSLDGQALVFNPNVGGHRYEQIELDVEQGLSQYRIEFDMDAQGLFGSDSIFTVTLDTPQVRTVSLHGDGDISVHHPSVFSDVVGTYTGDPTIHVTIDVFNDAGYWNVNFGGLAPDFTSTFTTTGGDVDHVRFALTATEVDPTVFVGLDNVKISSIPIPAAVWLFGSALAALAWRRKLSRSELA